MSTATFIARPSLLARSTAFQVTSPAPRAAWLEALDADPEALVTQTPTWLDFVCAAGRYEDASLLFEWTDGRRLVLPMARRRGQPARWAPVVSYAESWGMGGVVGSGAMDPDAIADIFQYLSTQPAIRASIRPNPRAAEAWAAACPPGAVTIPRRAHVLDLEGGFDKVWSRRFTGVARTAVRKAERSGLVVERDTTGRLLPVFYELFQQSIDRWAGLQHEPRALAHWRAQRRDPFQKLQTMARWLGDACRVWVAWSDGRPAASIVVLQGPNADYIRGAMDKQLAGPTRANYLLHRLAIEEACRDGCRMYHMGESGESPTLGQFKSRFGAEALPYAEYRLERIPLTSIEQSLRGLVKRAIGFRDVPVVPSSE